jgi:hypothetical protein
MKRPASEILRSLEQRIARLEKQSRNKTLFEMASKKQILQVYELVCTLLNSSKPRILHEEQTLNPYEGLLSYNILCRIGYTASITQICEEASKIFGQKVSREDILPFLDKKNIGDWMEDAFDVYGLTADEMSKSRYLRVFDYLPWYFDKWSSFGEQKDLDLYIKHNTMWGFLDGDAEGWQVNLWDWPRTKGDDFIAEFDIAFVLETMTWREAEEQGLDFQDVIDEARRKQ